MARTGRPKAEVTKNRIVTIRMKEEDYQRLKTYAERNGLTISDAIMDGVKSIINKSK